MTYLDHAATTPLSPAAAEAMIEAFGLVGNASSLHAAGRRARRVVEECRERIAAALDAHPSEVIFTGGGTEADNLAVKGIYWARRRADARRRRVVVSSVEHHAVSDAAEWLARSQDAHIDWVPVDRLGRVDPEVFAEVLGDPATVALASVMWANNEVGTVNPIAELAELAAERAVPLHSDAVQAVGAVPVGFRACGASALTISGHKIGGPAGIGVSLMGRGTDCVPVLHGGGQERELRSGTLDVPAIVGLAVAVEEAVRGRREFAARIAPLRDELVTGVLAAVPDAILNGPPLPSAVRGAGERGADSGILDRLPGNAHLSFPGCAGDGLLMLLDESGIACSTGSACTAGVARPSHVLLAMGVDEVTARGSLRFSLGHTSTRADVAAVTDVIGSVVDRARRRRKVSVRN